MNKHSDDISNDNMTTKTSTSPPPNPRVGVAAIITNAEGKVVCGKRSGSHGAGTWQLPGGHLEYGESFFECAEREALEETGLEVRGVKVVTVTNDVFTELGKHYITIFVKCDMKDWDAQPRACEPEKCAAWFWKSWDELRTVGKVKEKKGEELFLPLVHLFQEHDDVKKLL